jgi:FMN reductase
VSTLAIVGLVGNPRPESRTHGLARALTRELARVLPGATTAEVDLAPLGPRVLDPADAAACAAAGQVLAADVLVVASPTYKATYSGLLKAFLDRLATGSLAGKTALPVLLGGGPGHRLAVDLHFTPLLAELGASVPVRGLFVLEAEVDGFGATAAAWAAANGEAMAGAALRRQGLRATAPNASTSAGGEPELGAVASGRHLEQDTTPGSTSASPEKKPAISAGVRRT